MGGTQSEVKYVLLYGLKGCGKTLMLYNLHAKIKIFETDNKNKSSGPAPTEGFNYEEKKIGNYKLGIFDVSGDPMQYDILSIITRSVNISGIIFMVSLDQLDELKEAQQALKLLLSNEFFTKKLSLFVLYNRSSENKESWEWMSKELFNKQMKLDYIQENFKIKYIESCFHDCSICEISLNEQEQISTKLKEFANSLDENYKQD